MTCRSWPAHRLERCRSRCRWLGEETQNGWRTFRSGRGLLIDQEFRNLVHRSVRRRCCLLHGRIVPSNGLVWVSVHRCPRERQLKTMGAKPHAVRGLKRTVVCIMVPEMPIDPTTHASKNHCQASRNLQVGRERAGRRLNQATATGSAWITILLCMRDLGKIASIGGKLDRAGR